ncbi:hypothetical protein ACFC0C_23135 [Streptomyces sp. NPDC056178]|uniref:hypothetical protein n=1 Tax=unclassified Streptomyces TaxID=2593676 RepID=UPI0035E09BDB
MPWPTDEERTLDDELDRRNRIPGILETDPLPPIGLARSTGAPGFSSGPRGVP